MNDILIKYILPEQERNTACVKFAHAPTMSDHAHFSMAINTKVFSHDNYTARHWRESDRDAVAAVIRECLESYGLEFEAEGADLDAIAVEEHYLKEGRGEFWVVEDESEKVVGSGGFYRVSDEPGKAESEEKVTKGEVEIRKMYLLPEARGKQLGRALLEVNINTEYSFSSKLFIAVFLHVAIRKEDC